MRKGGGKSKGAAFERRVCGELSRMIHPNTEKTLFWRSAMSGGRSTVRGKQGKKDDVQAGDITCIHEAGMWLTSNFIIECKFYGNLEIKRSLLEGKGHLARFWREIENISDKHKKHPILIARENRMKTLFLTSKEGAHAYGVYKNLPPALLMSHELGSHVMVGVYDFEAVLEKGTD